jgi:SAM-dependent methyltransferase
LPAETEADALARLYDLDLSEDPGDLDLYLALARRTGGPILELAAGTGRLAVPLAAAGYDVHAVDIDPAMLARGRRLADATPGVAERLRWTEADLLDLRLDEAGTFGLAFLALNSLMLLDSRVAQRGALTTLAQHLAPGGLVVVDAWQPDAEDLARFDGRLVLEWTRTDPASGTVTTKFGSARHDAASQSVVLTAIFEEGEPGSSPRRWVRTDRLRLISADELAGLAEDVGLEIEHIGGGYDLAPVGPGSERAVLVAGVGTRARSG